MKLQFNSIQSMFNYNQAITSALEALYEYEAEMWNSRDGDKMCDPAIYNAHYDEELGYFIIPCWLSCEISYGDDGYADNDSYIPYYVEIHISDVEEYLRDNHGYD